MASAACAPTAVQELARLATSADPLPAAVRERGALHLLDTVGCGLAAVASGEGGHATAVAAAAGDGAATLFGSPATASPPLAALANGVRCHALDFDDTHADGICHASAVVAPAALAVGQAVGASGAAVLDAYARGCEVATRIAVAVADGAYGRGFHPTSVCGCFGAAAAAARLTGQDERRCAAALGVVASFASGLLEYLADGSATKPIHAGWAAQAGVLAAQLAAAGAEGPATALEGRFGLLAAHGADPASVADVVADLGERWEVAAMSIKPFPCCHFAHAATWAAAELADEHRIEPGEIASITVRTTLAGEQMVLDPLAAKQRPRTPYDAKFSLPYAVAHRLLHGELGLAAFSPSAIAEADVLALAARVHGEPLRFDDPAPSRFGGGARIVTATGATHDRFLRDAPGSPANPLSPDWIAAKFVANAGPALGRATALELAEALRAIEDAPTVDAAMAVASTATEEPSG